MATRRERVVLTLDDDFSAGMARAAAATALLNRELGSLSRQEVVNARSSQAFVRDVERMGRGAKGADSSINQLTGRLRLFADAAAILGPALVPLGGVAVAGIAGLTSQMGFAAVAGGVLIGSMQGLGDALKVLNDAHLEPSAENLAKVEDALNALSPAAADFAREAYDLLPILKGIRDAGAEGLFPGLTDSLDDLERLAPVVANIFNQVGSALGDIASSSAASLASDRWTDFFDFIATTGPRAISELASTVGDLTHGLAELWMAFTPLNNDFSGWLMDVAAGFDSWASGLDQTQGFRDFVDYIRTTGPQVAETLGALGNAVVQIAQAAAPLGGPVLAGIEALADTLAAIANTSVGASLIAAAAGFAAVSRAMTLINGVKGSALAGLMTDLAQNGEQAGRGARALGVGLGALLAIPALDAAQTQFEGLSTGLNALSRDLTAGTLPADFDNITESLTRLSDPNLAQGLQDNIYESLPFLGSDSRVDEATAQFEALDTALANIANTQGAGPAQAAFANLAESMGLTEDQTAALVDLLPNYGDALVGATAAAESAASSNSLYNMLEAESAALEKNIGLMQEKRDQALRSFSAQTNYAQALLDARGALEENGRAWNLNSEAGLKNRRVVEQQASAWNQLNREQGQTPAQARRARKALEDTAVSLGATKEEARRYAKQLLDIPNDLTTKIALDVDTAMQRARAIKAELASIDRSIDIYVNIRRPNASGFGPQLTSSADGGSVPKTGKPYADRHLYMLADGEEIISNRHGQADRFRADRASGAIPGYADGGTTGKNGKSKRRYDFGARDNTDALQAAIDRLTQVAEDQTSAVERQTARAEMWTEKMASVAEATTAGFRSNLFERGERGTTGGGPLANLNKDIAGLEARDAIQAQLKGMGITGDTLAALLSEGSNADLQGLIASGQVGDVAAAYQQRAALQASVGARGGQAAYGSQAAAAQKIADRSIAEQERTNLELIGLRSQLAQMERNIERAGQANADRTSAGVSAGVNSTASATFRHGGGKRRPKVSAR